ncbi:hypothetical protein LMG28138_05445 [Pararobbsia alpina]|uniref:Uncharacterized protein n=1 Tax=Pararobbsia alpina TaxID=621374 RepID=A0A6S7BVA2_9BURK|nr:hypothetical protein LMG28138_05445 [Pararobbsia alpina]
MPLKVSLDLNASYVNALYCETVARPARSLAEDTQKAAGGSPQSSQEQWRVRRFIIASPGGLAYGSAS